MTARGSGSRAGPWLPAPPSTPLFFGAKFEPPAGRIIHGMGQWVEDNRPYLDMLGDTRLYPLGELCFFDLEPPRPWELILAGLRTYLDRQKRTGRLPNINLGLSGPQKETVEWWKTSPPPSFGIDDRVAHSAQYDVRIRDVAQLLRDHGTPVFLRIGGEFNGPWNGHHPYDYPLAFRKVVHLFRALGAANTAFLWCYEPSAANDFDEVDAGGKAKWFPGDDVIDWYSLDVFARRDFSAAYPEFDRGGITPKGKSERFLRLAAEHLRPVMIAESSVVDYDITLPAVWDEWFGPYFAFLAAHPHIKAFVYVNAEWPRYRRNDPFGWKDGRVTLNPQVAARYVEEMGRAAYLHAPEVSTLQDYAVHMGVPFPPLQFTGVKGLNRSLLLQEWVHVLRWSINPQNGQGLRYRVYELSGQEPLLLGEIPGPKLEFVHRGIDRARAYHYSVTAVDAQGREGLAALITVR